VPRGRVKFLKRGCQPLPFPAKRAKKRRGIFRVSFYLFNTWGP